MMGFGAIMAQKSTLRCVRDFPIIGKSVCWALCKRFITPRLAQGTNQRAIDPLRWRFLPKEAWVADGC